MAGNLLWSSMMIHDDDDDDDEKVNSLRSELCARIIIMHTCISCCDVRIEFCSVQKCYKINSRNETQ